MSGTETSSSRALSSDNVVELGVLIMAVGDDIASLVLCGTSSSVVVVVDDNDDDDDDAYSTRERCCCLVRNDVDPNRRQAKGEVVVLTGCR